MTRLTLSVIGAMILATLIVIFVADRLGERFHEMVAPPAARR